MVREHRKRRKWRFAGRHHPIARAREAGFRFAEFNPEYNRTLLSQPYELVLIPDKGTLTIRQ